jgi:uncharacterized membrane protein
MRMTLNGISLVLLAGLFLMAGFAFYGPDKLPARIPTHFDAAGHANGWGSPHTLFLLPIIALGVYLLLTVVARFPGAFNYPVEVTPENRPRLEALALDLLAWVKAEMAGMFAAVAWMMLYAIHHSGRGFSPLWILVLAGTILITAAMYIGAMVRAAR